tara:strand:+ start:130 stop:708 length:579 start_codon:yes stop_codon:yes gene_type:complete
MTFAKDQKVKVIGGAHKGKWGYVFREMNEFCMVIIMDYKKAIARGDDEDLLVKREVRAKTKYLEVIPETIFEMPDESDLMPVFSLPTETHKVIIDPDPEPETIEKLIEDLKMPIPENDDDLLSNHSDDEPVDITDILPSMTEALQLRRDVRRHKESIEVMSEEIENLTTKNKELTEALDLFVKLCDFVRNAT